MATTVKYLGFATNQTYDDDALGYVSGDEVKGGIIEAAQWTVSAGAIAGAMAEERMDYGVMQHTVDHYAQYGSQLTPEQIAILTSTNPPPSDAQCYLIFGEHLVSVTPRTQAEWVADYDAVKDNLDSISPNYANKLLHPSLIDAGPSNMRIAVAIRLVNQYAATYQGDGAYLSRYLDPNDGYVKLVEDLMDDEHPLADHDQ
jgi:hypothetical protein